MLSYAQVCHKANRTKLVEVEGVTMTVDLASGLQQRVRDYTKHVEQLRATQTHFEGLKRLDRFPTPMQTPPVSRKQSIATRTFPFMSLPFEIRQLVLEHVVKSTEGAHGFDVHVPQYFSPHSLWYSPVRLPDIAWTGNAQIRLECILMVLKSATIASEATTSTYLLGKWLSAIDFKGIDTNHKTGLDAVQQLRLSQGGGYDQDADDRPVYDLDDYWVTDYSEDMTGATLANRCPNIRSLELRIQKHKISERGVMEADLTARRLFESNDLELILGLEHLEHLCLEVKVFDRRTRNEDLHRSYHELVEYLTAEFKQRNRGVRVDLTVESSWWYSNRWT